MSEVTLYPGKGQDRIARGALSGDAPSWRSRIRSGQIAPVEGRGYYEWKRAVYGKDSHLTRKGFL